MAFDNDRASCEPGSGCCGGEVNRRDLLKMGGLAAVMAMSRFPAFAGPFEPVDTADHFIPADKKLKPEWLKRLVERGVEQWYAGQDLRMIGMPVGGIAAGQLYVGGDGRLLYWDIYNRTEFTGYGLKNYFADPPASPIEQGFVIGARLDGATQDVARRLSREDFPGVRFCGEYPLARVEYADADFPIRVGLEAFSPFVPLNEMDSSLPATVMRFTVTNTSQTAAQVWVDGGLQNAVGRLSEATHAGVRVNRLIQEAGWTMVFSSAKAPAAPPQTRPPVVVETFEGQDYGKWTVEGEAFGKGPARGTLAQQQPVSGFSGKGLVNTFLGGDQPHGKLTSPPFIIERNYLCFQVGGGNHAGRTCINLLADGKTVRTATGRNREELAWQSWDVRDLAGKEVRIQIVDQESGGWGHINVDQIEQRDRPAGAGPLEKQIDFGTMGLAVLGTERVHTSVDWRERLLPDGAAPDDPNTAEAPFGKNLKSSVGQSVRLAPGESKTVTFIIAWHFPNRAEGHQYAVRFKDAADVVRYIAANHQRLYDQTRLWHKTWYEDSTLPRWLLDRLFSTVSTLATGTCLWRANGRFWAWEGVGCCEGTCAHVWNYEHAMARLFPRLERSVRTMQDLDPTAGFNETGAVAFRGRGNHWAADSQGGTAMKCLREHQMTADGAFLKDNWPRIRQTIQFLIDQDANADGLIESIQHNTYDINFFGANTMVGSLYLGALLAGEQLAAEVGDKEFAATCRKIFEAGRENSIKQLWNGEYFVQKVDLAKHPKDQYADGCLSDQLFGQGWAHQVGLEYVYPPEQVRSALKAIWTYNWAPDIGPQNEKHAPERWFARPGEAGLFICTWPKSTHLGKDSVRYRDEVWTGIEYQVAGNMVWDGMVTEALAICRAIHERYHPARHNPWNEIECGDHYARGMASYGVYLALCGFEYHGPKAHIGFAPKITPDNFSAAFTAAEGWGTFSQKAGDGALRAELAVKWGRLRLRTLSLGLAGGFNPTRVAVTIAGAAQPAALEVQDGKAMIRLPADVVIPENASIVVSLAA